jgi:predicted amidohydrolase
MYFPTGSGSDLLQVAIAQFNARDNKELNIETALEMIDRAAATGARLVVLPEIWTYFGDVAGIAAAAETVPGPLTDLLAERARRHGIY